MLEDDDVTGDALTRPGGGEHDVRVRAAPGRHGRVADGIRRGGDTKADHRDGDKQRGDEPLSASRPTLPRSTRPRFGRAGPYDPGDGPRAVHQVERRAPSRARRSLIPLASQPAYRRLGQRLRLRWWSFARRVSWTPPTSTEIGLVAKAGLAASLAWLAATLLTDVPDPVLAPLAALVTVQVSVRSSVKTALQRSGAVVLGVFVAIAIGDAIGLNMWTVGLLTGLSLAVAQLLLRLPRPAATQVPVSALVVLAAIASRKQSYGFERAFDTVIGAAVGVAVSLALPGRV